MSIILDHHIIWLQISVDDSLVMQILEREYKLRRVESDDLVGEHAFGLHNPQGMEIFTGAIIDRITDHFIC